MPQYRKLNTRTIESFDFNGLADDFARLTWVLLPLVSCKEGRGIDIPSWLISRLYPLRDDVTPVMINAVMADFEAHDMLSRYSIDGRRYYQITNWTKYQGSTDKESPSPYPAFESVGSRSGVGRELVESKSPLDVDADVDANTDADADADTEGESGAVAPAPISPPDFQPVPESVKRQKRRRGEPEPEPSITASAPPAVRLLAKYTSYWPGEDVTPALAARFGDTPDEVALARAVELWRMSSNKPTNWLGIADWYDEIRRDPAWTPQKRFKNPPTAANGTAPLSRSEEAAAQYAATKRAILGS